MYKNNEIECFKKLIIKSSQLCDLNINGILYENFTWSEIMTQTFESS